MPGWISVYKQIKKNWIWKDRPFSKGQAWIDILLSANYKDEKIPFEGQIIGIKRGQYFTSILSLSEQWGWSRKKVSNFLNILEKETQITQKRTTKYTLITIDKYDLYQDKEQQKNNKRTTEEQQRNTTNKDNKLNNTYTVEFEKFYSLYPRSEDKRRSFNNWNTCLKNYTVDELIQAAKNYTSAKRGTEKKYLKSSANFLGKEKPYEDYLPENYKKEKTEFDYMKVVK